MVTRLEFRKAINSSGFLFNFWFLHILIGGLTVASKLSDPSASVKPPWDTIFQAKFALIVIQFILHLFPDNRCLKERDLLSEETKYEETVPLYSELEVNAQTKVKTNEEAGTTKDTPKLLCASNKARAPCPELLSSYLRRITFTWITRYVSLSIFLIRKCR